MTTITKTWDKAGYLPGQKQKLTITFNWRSGNTVSVSYSLYAKSLGNDRYYYSERHNKFYIFQSINSVRAVREYQLRGYPKDGTYSGSFNITDVGNTVTSLDFYYQNDRLWIKHTNPSDPRSTGVVKKTYIGSLAIPANTAHSVVFKDIINGKTYNYSCYHDNNFTIPNLGLSSDKYRFLGWTTVNYTKGATGINIPNVTMESVSPSTSTGGSVKITSDVTYYAVWRPKICYYNFYWYDNYTRIFQIQHKWGTSTILPNLDEKAKYTKYNEDTYTQPKSKKLEEKERIRAEARGETYTPTTQTKYIEERDFKYPGYNFVGWHAYSSDGKFYDKGSLCEEWKEVGGVDFFPEKTPKLNKIRFKIRDKDLPNNELLFDYYTDDNFEMKSPLNELNTSDIFIKPGYKLIGWSTIAPSVLADTAKYKNILSNREGIAFPNTGYNLEGLNYYNDTKYYEGNYNEFKKLRIYPVEGEVVFNYDDFIDYDFVDDEPLIIDGVKYPYLNLYPYYEYYTTTYVYDGSEWKLAMPYVYKDNKWNMALSHIYNNDKWKL